MFTGLIDPSRVGSRNPLKVAGKWVCVDCRGELGASINGRKVRPALRCSPCGRRWRMALYKASQRAHSAVAKAIAAGDLQRPATFFCADCGCVAEHYDHRDYTKPLDVDPVCRKCNYKRGPAAVWQRATEPAQA